MMGLKGVLVPGEQCGPYRVKRVMEDGIAREDELDVDSDEEIIEQKREALERAMDDSYESACTGLVHAALLAAATALPVISTKCGTKRTSKVVAVILMTCICAGRRYRSRSDRGGCR